MTVSIQGIVAAPYFGMFVMGIFFPWANTKVRCLIQNPLKKKRVNVRMGIFIPWANTKVRYLERVNFGQKVDVYYP